MCKWKGNGGYGRNGGNWDGWNGANWPYVHWEVGGYYGRFA